jgi:hypothetical protein
MSAFKSIVIGITSFGVYLGLVHTPGGTAEWIVRFHSSEMPAVDILNTRPVEAINQFHKTTVKHNDNVVVGLTEAGLNRPESPQGFPNDVIEAMKDYGVNVPSIPKTTLDIHSGKNWNSMNGLDGNRRWVLTSDLPIFRRFMHTQQELLKELPSIMQRAKFADYYLGNRSMMSATSLLSSNIRHYYRFLRLRIRSALTENRIDDAITDCKTLHRFANHQTHSEISIFHSFGLHALPAAVSSWSEVLSHPLLTEKQLNDLEKSLDSLPELTLVPVLDVGERLMAHELLMLLEQRGMSGLHTFVDGGRGKSDDLKLDLMLGFARWGEIKDRVDAFYDRRVEISQIEDRQRRFDAIKSLELNAFFEQVQMDGFTNPRISLVSDVATEGVWLLFYQLVGESSIHHLLRFEQFQESLNIVNACVAMKRFHFDKKRFPNSLEELVGDYINEIPFDFHSGSAMKYLPLSDGGIIYSVGRNKKDDQGWGTEIYANLRSSSLGEDDQTFLVGIDNRPVPIGARRGHGLSTGRELYKDGDPHSLNFKGLSLSGSKISRMDLKGLSRLSTLDWLDLSYAELPSNWIETIAGLTSLKTLSLRGLNINQATLETLGILPQLETLVLNQSSISGSLEPLLNSHSLQRLSFVGIDLAPSDLNFLSKLKTLNWLNVSESNFNDDALRIVAANQNLKVLQMSATHVSDAGLRVLSNLPKLEGVELSDTSISNAGLSTVANNSLHTLRLSRTEIDNQIHAALANVPNLQALTVFETRFDQAGEAKFPKKIKEFDPLAPDNSLKIYWASKPTNGKSEDGESRTYETINTNFAGTFRTMPNTSLLEDEENTLRVKLDALASEKWRGFYKISADHVIAATVLEPIRGDFDFQVKTIPDWQQHDVIMRTDISAAGAPFIGAGLIIKQTDEHYLKWTWNSIRSFSFQNYSHVQPEYYRNSGPQLGPLRNYIWYWGKHRGGQTRQLIYPEPPVEGPLSFFDDKTIWLRLQRRGDVVTSWMSADGNEWKQIAKNRVFFDDDVEIGVWCGKLAQQEYVFHFEDFTIKQ